MIDNFELIKDKVLQFKKPGDFFVVHVIKRAKDLKAWGDYDKGDAMESQRLIKTWYIDSFEYWDEKVPVIKEIADANKARAYILPTVRNRLVVNRALLKKLVDMIDDTNCRYDHLIRTAVCGTHTSERPYWIVDVDLDLVPDSVADTREGKLKHARTAFVQNVLKEITPLVAETKRSTFEIFTVPTLNGAHVVTPPFNRSKWYGLYGELKTDPMTLLYFNSPEKRQ